LGKVIPRLTQGSIKASSDEREWIQRSLGSQLELLPGTKRLRVLDVGRIKIRHYAENALMFLFAQFRGGL
jgi:phage gp46-like protein